MSLIYMAERCRRSGDLLRLRIVCLKDLSRSAPAEERAALRRRIGELDALYRETLAVAGVLERCRGEGEDRP